MNNITDEEIEKLADIENYYGISNEASAFNDGFMCGYKAALSQDIVSDKFSINNTIPLKAIDIDKKKIVHDVCMITASGIVVNLFYPNPDSINLKDIAHGFAYTCRWNGATKSYYSVAEHCCRMYDVADTTEKKLTALFHDAEEAYWGDIISPLKKLLPKEIRDKMEDFRTMILDKFNINYIDEYIETLDKNALAWDLENLIKYKKHIGWMPNVARHEWLIRSALLS